MNVELPLTSGELRMVEHARELARQVDELLRKEISTEDIHEALRATDKINGTLQYLKTKHLPLSLSALQRNAEWGKEA